MLEPKSSAAIDFLKQWEPEGPWVLSAIAVDQKDMKTATFYPGGKKAKKWLDKYNGKWNLYFHVNRPMRDLEKKAERQDIKEITWLHIDIDPRAGEDLDKERERALNLLVEPPEGVPKPTVIIFSGGGYQGFWKLEDPIPVNGDLVKAEDAKRYNIQLEIVFGGDSCHNIDRIMRLPGTINLPTKTKIKKGRKPILAELLEFEPDRIYPVSTFTKAPEVQASEPGALPGGKVDVQISGNIKRLTDIDELDEMAGDNGPIPDQTKVLIIQGNDPNEPTKYSSRSEVVFAVCCELVRRGIDDQTIYSVITDPEFNISASIRDKKRGAEKYALRQIQRARENAISPKLQELNEKFAVIGNMGGKCRVIEEILDPSLRRTRITKQSFDDFRNRYMNKKIKVGTKDDGVTPVYMQLGKWWLQQEHRRQYDTIVFAPGQEPEGAYNLWRGFACEAKPGVCEKFLSHLHKNICNENTEYFTYLMGWMANCVQNPARPGGVAVVLRGRQGTGKSFFARSFGSLWGRHFLQVSDPKHLVGSFNAHLRDCIVLFGDEAFYAGDKKHESVLKMLITESTITVEAKGVDAESSPNYTHLILASNSSWVVPAGADERRFFVLDIGDKHMQDTKYFGAIQAELDQGGREALLHMLLALNLKEWSSLTAPRTEALTEQKILSFSPEEEWWHRKLVDGIVLRHQDTWVSEVPCDAIVNDYLNYTQKLGVNRRATATMLGCFLKKATPPGYPRRRQKPVTEEVEDHQGKPQLKTSRKHHYIFPGIDEARLYWDNKFSESFEWEPTEDNEKDKEVF